MRKLLLGLRGKRACHHNIQLMADYLRALDDSYRAHQPYISAYLAKDFGRLPECRGELDEAREKLWDARERLMQHQTYHGCSPVRLAGEHGHRLLNTQVLP